MALSEIRKRIRLRLAPLRRQFFGQVGDVPETTVVFDNVLLKCESWETGKRDSRIVPVKLTSLAKSELVFTIQYVRGTAPFGLAANYGVKVWVNDILYVDDDIMSWETPGPTSVVGTLDITETPIANTRIEIGMNNTLGAWGEVSYHIALVNYYTPPPPPQFNLTIASDGGGYTTPQSGVYPYDEGTIVQVVATPYQGQSFVHWLRGVYIVSTNLTLTVAMDTDVSLTAVFVQTGTPPPPPPEPECSLANPPPPGYTCVDGKLVPIVEPPNGNGPTPTEPITETIHLFDEVHLETKFYETAKRLTKTFRAAPSILAGAHMNWSISHIKGNDPSVNAKIRFNDQIIREGFIPQGSFDSGSIDLTGTVLDKNSIEIWFGSDPALWSELVFDITIVLEYTEDPGPTCPFPVFLPRILTDGEAPILCAIYSLFTGSKR